MSKFNEISANQLLRLIGLPDAPAIIDVRLAEDLAALPVRVPTAQPLPHDRVTDWMGDVADRHCVVICHKGLKLSHGTAAILRDQGISAEVLSGGMVAWVDAGLPASPLDQLAKTDRWVTRHRPKIDRIACPWLIHRFVNPAAQFLYVPPGEVMAVAERFDATPFDVPGVPFAHHGDRCSFDALIAAFGLDHPALARLADVVRAADVTGGADVPEAAGLLAMSVGLSRMHRDDSAQLAAAMPLYDALYRWARDGFTEQHSHDPEGGA